MTDVEIEAIRAHVASVGFDTSRTVRARGEFIGLAWQGHIIRTGDQLHNGEVHYLRHVVKGHEWPTDTSYDEYVESLRRVISDPRGGILIESHLGYVRLSFVARSHEYQGPEGGEWILVGYTVVYGSWATGFQPDMGLSYFASNASAGKRWLRRPIS